MKSKTFKPLNVWNYHSTQVYFALSTIILQAVLIDTFKIGSIRVEITHKVVTKTFEILKENKKQPIKSSPPKYALYKITVITLIVFEHWWTPFTCKLGISGQKKQRFQKCISF